MRRDIYKKNERIAAIENELEQQQLASDAQLQNMQTKLEGKLASHQLREQETEAKLRDQVDSLTVQLKV
jgi:hypothetical protein